MLEKEGFEGDVGVGGKMRHIAFVDVNIVFDLFRNEN